MVEEYCRFCYNRDMSNYVCTFRFGFVDFPTHEEAKEAVSKTVEIFGHKLNLDFAAKNQFQKKRMSLLIDTVCGCNYRHFIFVSVGCRGWVYHWHCHSLYYELLLKCNSENC